MWHEESIWIFILELIQRVHIFHVFPYKFQKLVGLYRYKDEETTDIRGIFCGKAPGNQENLKSSDISGGEMNKMSEGFSSLFEL